MSNRLKRVFFAFISCSFLISSLFPQKGKVLWSFSQFGEQDFFHKPSDIAIDPSLSRIYIADSGNHRVVVFDFQGKFLGTIGKEGQGPAEFTKPTGIFVLTDSHLAVADSNSNRIQIFDKTGTLIQVINTKGTKVADLIVTDEKFFTIPSFGTSGYSLNMRSDDKSEPLVNMLDAEGNKIQEILVSDFPESHPFIRAIKHRVCLALSSDKKLYLPYFAMNVIQVFDLDGRKIAEFERPLEFKPISPHLKQQRSAEGFIQMVASLDMVSQAAHFGPDGRLYILTHTEAFNERIKKAKKPEELRSSAMRIDVIEPSTHRLVRTIPCGPGTQAFGLLDKERLVYIHEDSQGELILKCVKY